jgi:3'(2'), 5'-bisphosphate nucleotidase
MNPETEKYIRMIDAKGKPVELKSKGSALKICMVAEGVADIYPRLAPTMEWDTAAGHAIIKFAGKEIIQFENNEPLVYNKENLLNPWFVVK